MKYCANVPWNSVRHPFGVENIKKIKLINTEEEVIYTVDYNVVENTSKLMISYVYLSDKRQKVMKIDILDKYSENRYYE